MQYLITTNETDKPFLTDWFDAENNFNSDVQMIVYDLVNLVFTTDGKTWKPIDIDHL